MPNKRVIVAVWKTRIKNRIEIYSSLKNFCLAYPAYNYNTLSNYLSKRKIAYENERVFIERKAVISEHAIRKDAPARNIAQVVRKVLLKEANDFANDLDYWLSKPPSDRVAAVTSIISQSLKKGQRMDKGMIVHRKLKA